MLNSDDLKNHEVKIKNCKTKVEDVISLDTLIYYLDENLDSDYDCEDCNCGDHCTCSHDHECDCHHED